MAEPAAKIRVFWLIVAAIPAFLLGALLFRGCKPQPVTIYKEVPVNLDSLKRTIPPDTVFMPGNQIVRIVRVPFLMSDTTTIDSLIRTFQGQVSYYEELIRQLRGDDRDFGWNWSESVVLETKENFYSDSVSTATYFHRWNITAEGPIRNYTYQVIPLCPMVSIPDIRKPLRHRVGLFAGLQTTEGSLRQIYGGMYRYKFVQVQVGYLPAVSKLSLSGAVQVSVGVDIGIK